MIYTRQWQLQCNKECSMTNGLWSTMDHKQNYNLNCVKGQKQLNVYISKYYWCWWCIAVVVWLFFFFKQYWLEIIPIHYGEVFGPKKTWNDSQSSFPFSLPRSFLSFFVVFIGPSSPVHATDTRLCPPDMLEAPTGAGVNETGGVGKWQLKFGVGIISPSDRDWYCNRDFSKNLQMKIFSECGWIIGILGKNGLSYLNKTVCSEQLIHSPPLLLCSVKFLFQVCKFITECCILLQVTIIPIFLLHVYDVKEKG